MANFLDIQFWELLSYIVTVLGLPMAMFAVLHEMHAERINEHKEIEQREDEIYVELSRQYSGFLESVLASPDLDLMSVIPNEQELTKEQKQKRIIYYEMLIALFERAFILLYETALSGNAQRRWNSWNDYISWWVAKPDFRDYVVRALEGEDPEFVEYIEGVVKKEVEK